jgi:hypothetical protein
MDQASRRSVTMIHGRRSSSASNWRARVEAGLTRRASSREARAPAEIAGRVEGDGEIEAGRFQADVAGEGVLPKLDGFIDAA